MPEYLVFQKWIDFRGGFKSVAKLTGNDESSVWRWYHRERSPKIATMVKLVDLSDGCLSVESIWRDTRPVKAKGVRK